ncbi:MAG: PDZ domain-containing protein [Gammaproteobacteria bacterium]|nr:PDZ domain-containing protein [Gammaproteobacteria bacterium]NNF61865.1 PDZ domain-containing protein [Gammaproteobacteria bacterium]
MLRQLAFFLPVFVAGIVLGAWAREPAEPVPQSARDFDHAADYQRLETMITSLTEIVNLEVAERRRLEEQLSNLNDKVAGLVGESAERRQAAAKTETSTTRSAAPKPVERRVPGEVDAARFEAAGFAPDVAQRLKRDMDQIALDRLFLRDQAVREGWLNSSRYREQLRALNQRQEDLRKDLSPADYDRYLYALGRPNRIVISSVLSGSPADTSGLQPGDAILSYNGNRVYSPSEIRRETSRGDAGSVVPVEVLRNGQTEVIYLPRGPLGVNMSSLSARP